MDVINVDQISSMSFNPNGFILIKMFNNDIHQINCGTNDRAKEIMDTINKCEKRFIKIR